ncbi:MAG: thiamine pyrophosphate-requiring protein [Alicyclobacillus sp.]|nr:thiamine pyrophosphate-requiring protein [Alicyclobacillus sp.]
MPEIREAQRTAVTATTADVLLKSLVENGVSYIFGNFGSDHTAILEGLAKAEQSGREMPRVVLSPHETVALAAAHGYALASGRAQCVMVHCDVGTQNLGGAVHNACRARVPVLIFAGETPFTLAGELRGTRNREVNHLQDVYDQASILRPYIKWEYRLRTGRNTASVVHRALQLAESDPKGPVYLMGAREVLEEEVPAENSQAGDPWPRLSPPALPTTGVAEMLAALLHADHPLLITSYVGRHAQAVAELVKLCETLAIPVIEHKATYCNFPADHPLHLGYSVDDAKEYFSQADVVLVLDTDVPWIESIHSLPADCRVFAIDIDPIKQDIPLWHQPARRFYQADSYLALQQFNARLQKETLPAEHIRRRWEAVAALHDKQRQTWHSQEQANGPSLTPAFVTACLRSLLHEDVIVVDESITNAHFVRRHLPRTRPDTYYSSGGSSLGWCGGAAVGVKLARPNQTVVCFAGDGSYFLSVPSTVYWMARKYHTPFLTVIWNNGGWNATKQNVNRLHPGGSGGADWVRFEPLADLAKIAEAAGGAGAFTIASPNQVRPVLEQALATVRQGRAAVVDVRLPQI